MDSVITPEQEKVIDGWVDEITDTEDEQITEELDDLIDDGMLRLGNNRYHQPKSVSKAKRKAAKKSKQKQRKKK